MKDGMAKVSGFVVMPDHVHAVLWFDDESNLPKVMQKWKAVSAQNLKMLYQKIVPEMLEYLKKEESGKEYVSFWVRRYYDFNIRTPDKLVEKLKYMHENPVRKGLVKKPENYLWSSAAWYTNRKSVGVKIDPGF